MQHDDSRRVLLEIVGFWTPDYLEAKVASLRTFADEGILLAVAESNKDKLPAFQTDPILYKTALKIDAVLSRLAALRNR